MLHRLQKIRMQRDTTVTKETLGVFAGALFWIVTLVSFGQKINLELYRNDGSFWNAGQITSLWNASQNKNAPPSVGGDNIAWNASRNKNTPPSVDGDNIAMSARFTNDVRLNVDRGLNIINMYSGHRMAAYIYDAAGRRRRRNRSWQWEPKSKLLSKPSDAAKLSGGDNTLYVNIDELEEFTRDFLPYINTTFVLICGSKFLIKDINGRDVNSIMKELAPIITGHDGLLRWFSTNIGMYTGGHQFHPKVSPFPIGLKPKLGALKMRNPVPHYRREFLKTIDDDASHKPNPIYVSFLGPSNPDRNSIPNSQSRVDYPVYLRELSNSSYVLSPDGDTPDCHRHYEALGLGTVPITQLDPYLYSHLKGAGPAGAVIFNNSNWNLTDLERTLPFPAPKINRNIVFEEYWMEHIENIVGKKLWWWDVVGNKRSKMEEFVLKSNITLDDMYPF